MYGLFAFLFQNTLLLRGCTLFILGSIIGSFLNVVIYRLPIILDKKEEANLNSNPEIDTHKVVETFNLVYPSSHCPVCKNRVPIWANIPILGYFLTNGKCCYCKTKISVRYPALELITGLLFVLSGSISSDIVMLPAFLVFISIVICLIVIDFDHMILPDELTGVLLWAGLLFNLNGAIAGSLINAVLGVIVGYLLLWLLYWGFKFITKRDGMGYGDFKFLAAILAWVGYLYIVPVLLISSILGIIYFVLGRLTGRVMSGHPIPFGPFLGIAGIITLLSHNFISIFIV